MHFHWLLVGTLMMLIVTTEGAQLIRNARRKRRAQALRTRAIDAQRCGASTEIAVQGYDHT